MTDNSSNNNSVSSEQNPEQNRVSPYSNPNNIDPDKYAFLRAEAAAPYKGLRKFIYFSFGASGAIGAFIFFVQIIAGKNISDNLGNLAIQVVVIALMVFLFMWEDRKKPNKDAK